MSGKTSKFRSEFRLLPNALRAGLPVYGPVSIFGTDFPTPDATCVRDFVHIHNLAVAHLLVLQAREPLNVRSRFAKLLVAWATAHSCSIVTKNPRGFGLVSTISVLDAILRLRGSGTSPTPPALARVPSRVLLLSSGHSRLEPRYCHHFPRVDGNLRLC